MPSALIHRACNGALQKRDAAVERWLREEFAPALDAHSADPDNAPSLGKVAERLDAFRDSAGREDRPTIEYYAHYATYHAAIGLCACARHHRFHLILLRTSPMSNHAH